MIPVMIIKGYRRIPAPVRRLWSAGQSTSHLALAAVAAARSPWRELWTWARPLQGPDQLWFTRKP